MYIHKAYTHMATAIAYVVWWPGEQRRGNVRCTWGYITGGKNGIEGLNVSIGHGT